MFRRRARARFPTHPRSLLSTAQAPPARRPGPVRCRNPGPGPVTHTKETLKERLRRNARASDRLCRWTHPAAIGQR